MNILTFDIEEWALVDSNCASDEKYAVYDIKLNNILDLLDKRGIKATFFCTGMMAKSFSCVVKKIHNRGHEIGCHSNIHNWLNKMTEIECREDTHCAIDSLEQCIGQKVYSYRAPAFSIGNLNKWAFEILVENGIERDASIFPIERDFGGFPGFAQDGPCVIKYNGIQIKEFPICTAKLLGKELVYSGGGYFRFFPLSFIEKEIKNSTYSICYFHIGDLVNETNRVLTRKEYEAYFKEPGSLVSRYKRYLKTNIGKKTAFKKLNLLIMDTDFMSVSQADSLIDWTSADSVIL